MHGVLPQEDGGTNFGVKGGHVKLGFEWGASQYGGLTEKQLNGGTPLLFLKK